jgi:hypothetical protein
MENKKHIKSFNEHQENLNISDVRSSEINEMYMNKPGEERSELMFKYGVDILPDNTILKDGKRIGKIETHMIPSGKYFVRDNTKRHLDLKDSFEDALKSMLD